MSKPRKIDVDTSGLDKAKSDALALGITVAAVGAAPGLLALASVVLGVGAGFAAASTVAGGFTGELSLLEQAARSGAESVGGFSSALGDTGVAAMQDFESAAADVGDALGHLFVDLAPEIDAADGVVKDIAADFDKWAQTVSASDLTDFFSKLFGDVNLDEVKTDLGDIATFIENLAKAEQDMSPLAMGALTAFLDVLGHLNPTSRRLSPCSRLSRPWVPFAAWWTSGSRSHPRSATSRARSPTCSAAATRKRRPPRGKRPGRRYTSGVDEGAGTAAEGIETAMGGLGEAASEAANAAGMAAGASFAAGFGEGIGELGAALAGAVGEAGPLALIAAAAAGFAIGAAVGTGFAAGLGTAGAGGLGAKLASEVEGAGSGASSWLEPAGADAVQGFADGFESGAGAVAAEGGKITEALTSGLSDASGALEKEGEQAAQGFMTGLARGSGPGCPRSASTWSRGCSAGSSPRRPA